MTKKFFFSKKADLYLMKIQISFGFREKIRSEIQISFEIRQKIRSENTNQIYVFLNFFDNHYRF